MEHVNIKKLAAILNLSISAVSKALRDSHDISRETKEKVRAMAKTLNYQPNPHASSLRQHKSKTIAVIVPEVANNFFALAINGIESVAQEKNYHVLIYLTHEDVKKERVLTRYLHGGRVDGVIISVSTATADYAHLRQLQENGLPLVFFDRVGDNFETGKITTDDYESSYLATEHLIRRGCSKPAHLAMTTDMSIGKKRQAGYLKALEDNGLTFGSQLILRCGHDQEQNRKGITHLLRTGRPDGIFAAVEQYALCAYACCRSEGLSIPGDVKIICFSNLGTADLLNPSLTTITQPAFDMGKEAALLLFRALEKKHSPLGDETIILKSVLQERDSTAAGVTATRKRKK
jgi:LacI family transcriptional regulator